MEYATIRVRKIACVGSTEKIVQRWKQVDDDLDKVPTIKGVLLPKALTIPFQMSIS